MNYTQKVTARLEENKIPIQFHAVDPFDTLEVMKKVSRIIVKEKEKGNNVYVNMSACGRKTAFAVTIAAMFHDTAAYYVAADSYATGVNSIKESDHGMSIVESGNIELLQQFRIMKPDDTNIALLAELYRRKSNGKPDMKSDDIIDFFYRMNVHGFDVKPEDKRGMDRSKLKRALLNRINRMHLEGLEKQKYIEKKKVGKEFFVTITDAGSHIACVSGLID
ncbi:MAG: DUF6293 family protein [Methanoregula sp.]|nr:DUF6293 family protein [Methanoregula sp.]